MSDPSRAPIVDEWGGFPRWRCPLCPFDTLTEAVLIDHLRGVHHEPEGGEPEAVELTAHDDPHPSAEALPDLAPADDPTEAAEPEPADEHEPDAAADAVPDEEASAKRGARKGRRR